jgi:hypothetical protein
MERLTKEQAFQLHNEFDNIDDTSMDAYICEDALVSSEASDRERWSE